MIAPAARRALTALLGERIAFDVPMSRHTSLRVGGPADALAQPESRDECVALLRLCSEHGLPHTIVGAGFNTLVTDAGIEGVVLKPSRLRAIERQPGPRVFAEAGVSHATLTRFCCEQGLAGLEFGCGIPGAIGGWVAMNAGIGTREVVDVIDAVEVVEGDGRDRREVPAARLDFVYRSLASLAPGALVLSARFAVSECDPKKVRAEVDALLAKRSRTQPLNVPSCGSVFKNPPGDYAGRLIEAAGLKGAREGGAQITPLHANFIANTGGATAADVLRLIERARAAVERTSGIALETEVRIVGRDRPAGGAR